MIPNLPILSPQDKSRKDILNLPSDYWPRRFSIRDNKEGGLKSVESELFVCKYDSKYFFCMI